VCLFAVSVCVDVFVSCECVWVCLLAVSVCGYVCLLQNHLLENLENLLMSCYTEVDCYLSKVIPVVVPVISKQILKCLHKFLRGNFCVQ